MQPIQMLVDEGDLRATLNIPSVYAREIRDTLNNLHHLMTELVNVDKYQVQHYALCLNSRS